MEELAFEAGVAKRATLEAYTREILEELLSPEGAADLESVGVSRDLLSSGVSYGFEVRTSQLFGLGETVFVTLVAGPVVGPIAKKVLLDLWKDVVRPRIKRRFGDDAIGEERAAKTPISSGAGDAYAELKKPKKAKTAAAALPAGGAKPTKVKEDKKSKKNKKRSATKNK